MKGLKIIGITGTNGKTTTAFLTYYLLKKMGRKTSMIGTIKYFIGSKSYKAKLTTPGFVDLTGIVREVKKAGSDFLVIEASSHGLDQGRVRGLKFHRALFTNLSRDHLDYHKTMEDYFAAKKKLFLPQKNTVSFINVDDYFGRKLFRGLDRAFSFAIDSPADFKAENIVLGKKGTDFELLSCQKRYPVRSKLCGKYNVLNILGAVGVVSSLGFPLGKVVKAVSGFRSPKGRLKPVAPGIFIDYAHTPDALSNALSSLRELGYGKIICLFGCGGDRDKGKRRLMGEVAASKAEYTFITSDNPRSEDPLKICRQISKGFKVDNYSIIVDRRKAIDKAMRLFFSRKSGNYCLLLAGKGHEDYQIISVDRRVKKIPFSDKKIVKEFLNARG